MRPWGWLVIAVALVVSVALLVGPPPDDPEVVALKRELARLDSMNAFQAEVIAEYDREAEAHAAREDSIRQAADARVRAARGETDRVLAALPDSIRGAVTAAVEAERAEHEQAMSDVTFFYTSRDALRLKQIASRDDLIGTLQAQLVTKGELVDRLEDKLRPDLNLFGLAVDFECVGGVGVAAGYGQAAGVGIACGLKL